MKEFEDNGNSLQKVGKRIPLAIPSDYFDSLPKRIQSKCVAEPKSELTFSHQPLYRRATLTFGIITLCSIALAGYLFIHPQSPLITSPESDYVRIVQQHISEFDHSSTQQVSDNDVNESLDEYQEQVIKYLVFDQIDYITLINEY